MALIAMLAKQRPDLGFEEVELCARRCIGAARNGTASQDKQDPQNEPNPHPLHSSAGGITDQPQLPSGTEAVALLRDRLRAVHIVPQSCGPERFGETARTDEGPPRPFIYSS